MQPGASAAAPAPTQRAKGGRKGAQKQAEPTLEQRAAEAESAVLTAKRALTRAEAAETAAEKRVEECGAQLDRIVSRAAKHFSRTCHPKKHPECCHRWRRHIDQGQQTLNDTFLAWKDAQISTHEARYEWRDLLEESLSLEQESYRESSEQLISALERENEMYRKRARELEVISRAHSGASV